jgi:hypothetical protein
MANIDYLLAGYERGGTTLLSEIFRANGYESGFECGVLMAEAPRNMPEIKPYWDMLLPWWKISEETRNEAITGNFKHFYDTLCHTTFPEFKGHFFDKTPIYMSQLGLCMHRAPNLKGAIVIHRDPRAVFLSMSKRLSPDLLAEAAVETNFEQLTKRYLSYFVGCVTHVDNPHVLFVPFEELVSREDVWLKNIGNFTNGKSFSKRQGKPRYSNVTSAKMDLGKVMEFDGVLSKDLQTRILDATKLASLFFSDATDRANFGQYWHDIKDEADTIIHKYNLQRSIILEDGTYFEPFTYLLRNEDVRKAGINPVDHFFLHGKKEKRRPH